MMNAWDRLMLLLYIAGMLALCSGLVPDLLTAALLGSGAIVSGAWFVILGDRYNACHP